MSADNLSEKRKRSIKTICNRNFKFSLTILILEIIIFIMYLIPMILANKGSEQAAASMLVVFLYIAPILQIVTDVLTLVALIYGLVTSLNLILKKGTLGIKIWSLVGFAFYGAYIIIAAVQAIMNFADLSAFASSSNISKAVEVLSYMALAMPLVTFISNLVCKILANKLPNGGDDLTL